MTDERIYRVELDSGRVFEVQAVSEAAASAAAKFVAGLTKPAEVSFRRAVVPVSAEGLRVGTSQKYLAYVREIAAEEHKPTAADQSTQQ